jgi:hypothetical protein
MGMGKKWKKKAPVLPRLLAACVVLLVVFVYFRRPASDAALLRRFNRNLADFLELRSMLATNLPASPLTVSADVPVWSLEQYQRYQALLRRAGVIRVVQEGPDVRFQLVGPLEPGKGERIAITCSEAQPDFMVASIRELRKQARQRDHAYLQLTNDWYLWVAK